MNAYLTNSLKTGIYDAKSKGFDTTFFYKNKKILSKESGRQYELYACDLVLYYRFEGRTKTSAPRFLFLLECPDGTKGYLVSSFTTYADLELKKIMIDLKKRNEESLLFI